MPHRRRPPQQQQQQQQRAPDVRPRQGITSGGPHPNPKPSRRRTLRSAPAQKTPGTVLLTTTHRVVRS